MAQTLSFATREIDQEETPTGIRPRKPRHAALLSPREVGELYDLTRRSVMGLIRRKTLPAIMDGGRYKVRLSDAERILGTLPAWADEEGYCRTCEHREAQTQTLKEEIVLLRARLRRSEEAQARTRGQATLLAEAIKKDCTGMAEVDRVINDLIRPESDHLKVQE